eukprot:11034778-Ditylum_brightwellii.AAC.1
MLDHVGTALLLYNVDEMLMRCQALEYGAVPSLFAFVYPQMDQDGSIDQDGLLCQFALFILVTEI